MAGDAEQLAIELEARVQKLEQGMGKAEAIANKAYAAMKRGSGSATRQMEQDMQRSTTRINQYLAQSSTKMGAYAKAFGIGVAGGVVAALAPMALLDRAIKDIGEAAGLKRLADRIGISTTMLQSLQYAAVQAGVNVDQMGDGLGDFAAKVAEAASGAGQLAPIFKANGVELKNQDGTLRSTRDVLRDFANLIQNAQTPAERLYLAQQAFGDEAAKMVPIFEDGARGLDKLEASAKSAGAVVSEELITRAEELDKRLSSMWEVFSARSKSAILTAIQGMDSLLDKLQQYEKRKAYAEAGAYIGSLVKPKGSVLTTGTGDKPTALDARMAGALRTELSDADQRLVDALKARYGDAAQKATVIPSSSSGSKGGGTKGITKTSDDAFADNIRAVEDMIAAMKIEQEGLGLSAQAREKATLALRLEQQALHDVQEAARRKGDADWRNVQLSQQQKEAIDKVSTAYAAQAEQLRQAMEAQEVRQDAVRTGIDGVRNALEDGKITLKEWGDIGIRVLDRFIDKLETDFVDAIFQANNAGGGGGFLQSLIGGIGSLFGGGGSSIPWAQDLFRANGGPVDAGQPYIVGERRPELFVPDQPGTILPYVPPAGASQSTGAGVSQNVEMNLKVVVEGNGDKELMDRMQAGAEQIVGKAMQNFARSRHFASAVASSLPTVKINGMARR